MSNTPHQIVVYKKPREAISGTRTVPIIDDRILGTYDAYNYKHQIIAMGGDDSASCELGVTKDEAFEIFGAYLGNRIQAFVNNPSAPIFEGYINRINLEIEGFKFSVSLDSLGNRVMMSYFNTVSLPNTKVTSEVTDQASIDVFGSKMATQDLGIEYLSTDTRHNTQRDLFLAKQSDPYKQMTVAPSGNATGYSLKIEIRGFYHTLAWDTFETTANTQTVGSLVTVAMVYAGNAASIAGYNSSRFADNGYGVFFNTEDFSDMDFSNAVYTSSMEKRGGQSHLDFIRQHVEPGDGINDYVFGITRTDPNLRYRRGYYRQANTETKYFTNMFSDRRIYSSTGELIDPWTITPDANIAILDLPSFNTPLNTQTASSYITKVTYDGESGLVTWASKEDLTLSGQYQTGKVNRAEGSPFGQLTRRSYY